MEEQCTAPGCKFNVGNLADTTELKHSILRLHWDMCAKRDRRAEAGFEAKAVVARLECDKPGCAHRPNAAPGRPSRVALSTRPPT